MIWTTEGVPLHGLTGGTWRDRRTDFIIPKGWKMGKEHIFYIETSMNGMFGKKSNAPVNAYLTLVRLPPRGKSYAKGWTGYRSFYEAT